MNTYAKFCPNVFLAKCEEQHKKGDVILVQTKHEKENECIVFNLILEKNGFYYYSIIRKDGFNTQEWAKNKAQKLENAALNAAKKSNDYLNSAFESKDFLALGEPIKVGHHSEKKHRALIERNNNRMSKAVEFSEKSKSYEDKIAYWESKVNIINLSMPESLEYFKFKVEQAKLKHEGLKNGSIKREHSYSLTYAKKELNELQKNLELAQKLWA